MICIRLSGQSKSKYSLTQKARNLLREIFFERYACGIQNRVVCSTINFILYYGIMESKNRGKKTLIENLPKYQIQPKHFFAENFSRP
jgi:hypothetical protein